MRCYVLYIRIIVTNHIILYNEYLHLNQINFFKIICPLLLWLCCFRDIITCIRNWCKLNNNCTEHPLVLCYTFIDSYIITHVFMNKSTQTNHTNGANHEENIRPKQFKELSRNVLC